MAFYKIVVLVIKTNYLELLVVWNLKKVKQKLRLILISFVYLFILFKYILLANFQLF